MKPDYLDLLDAEIDARRASGLLTQASCIHFDRDMRPEYVGKAVAGLRTALAHAEKYLEECKGSEPEEMGVAA